MVRPDCVAPTHACVSRGADQAKRSGCGARIWRPTLEAKKQNNFEPQTRSPKAWPTGVTSRATRRGWTGLRALFRRLLRLDIREDPRKTLVSTECVSNPSPASPRPPPVTSARAAAGLRISARPPAMLVGPMCIHGLRNLP